MAADKNTYDTEGSDFWNLARHVEPKNHVFDKNRKEIKGVDIDFGANESPSDKPKNLRLPNLSPKQDSPADRKPERDENPRGGEIDIDFDGVTGQFNTSGDFREERTTVHTPDNDYIIKCTVENFKSSFSLYRDFLDDAKRNYTKTCMKADYVYYFSFRSQFKELDENQFAWYLYWRSKVRNGEYIKTGMSYIFLYLYELINLSDIIGEQKAFDSMIQIWLHYREDFPRINKYMFEWITDFALIHQVKIDFDPIRKLIVNSIFDITLPELFLNEGFFTLRENVPAVITKFSLYKYQSSKYYTDQTKELFETHIENLLYLSLCAAVRKDGQSVLPNKFTTENSKYGSSKMVRESFSGAVCCYEKKKRITVEYVPVIKNDAIKSFVTEVVRSAENLIRDHLKIKSKLNAGELSAPVAEIFDKYRKEVLPPPEPKVKKIKTPDSDYDPVPEESYEFTADISAAADIEKRSWSTTKTLVELQNKSENNSVGGNRQTNTPPAETVYEEFDYAEHEPTAVEGDGNDIIIESEIVYTELSPDIPIERAFEIESAEPVNAVRHNGMNIFDDYKNCLDVNEISIIKIFLTEQNAVAKAREYAASKNIMLEFLIDSANEKAYEYLGDAVFLNDDPARPQLIDDYVNDLSGAFS